MMCGLFSSGTSDDEPEDDGCSGHHYGEKQKTGMYKIEDGHVYPVGWVAMWEWKEKCKHSGCSAIKTGWNPIVVEDDPEKSADWREDERDGPVTINAFSNREYAREALAEYLTGEDE